VRQQITLALAQSQKIDSQSCGSVWLGTLSLSKVNQPSHLWENP